MFEKAYKDMNRRIMPDRRLIDDTLEMVSDAERSRGKRRAPSSGRAIAIAAMALCLSLVTPALAARVPATYELMYRVSPAIAQFFVPVQESCEDNGIRMSVVPTFVRDDTAKIYVTMQDLTGDRVDETTDLFDSYSLHIPFGSLSRCERVSYDPATRSVAFLITISTMHGAKIPTDGKVTFSVKEFLSRNIAIEGIMIPLDLAVAAEAETTLTFSLKESDMYTYVGGSSIGKREPGSYDAILVPRDPIYPFGNGMDVTGIGFVDGQLHVQVVTSDKLAFDTHGDLRLVDSAGSFVHYNSVYFAADMGTADRVDYQEFIFDVGPEEIGRYKLSGNYYSNGMNTKGDWRVVFKLVGQ